MATRFVAEIIDDVTGKPVTEENAKTVTLTVDGVTVELDVDVTSKAWQTLKGIAEKGHKPARSNVVPIGTKRQRSSSGGIGNSVGAKEKAELNATVRAWVHSVTGGRRVIGLKGRLPGWAFDAYDKQDPTLIPGYKPATDAVQPAKPVKTVPVTFSEPETTTTPAKAPRTPRKRATVMPVRAVPEAEAVNG